MSGVIDRKGNDHRSSAGGEKRRACLADFENSAGGGRVAPFHRRCRAVRKDYEPCDNTFTRVFHLDSKKREKKGERKRKTMFGNAPTNSPGKPWRSTKFEKEKRPHTPPYFFQRKDSAERLERSTVYID